MKEDRTLHFHLERLHAEVIFTPPNLGRRDDGGAFQKRSRKSAGEAPPKRTCAQGPASSATLFIGSSIGLALIFSITE
jgi:hypothetical protein